MKVKVDGYTRFLLTAITILLTFVVVGLWYETPSTVPMVRGQIPDSGAQLAQIIKQVEDINRSLSTLPGLLTSGKVKVQVVEEVKERRPRRQTEASTTPKGK